MNLAQPGFKIYIPIDRLIFTAWVEDFFSQVVYCLRKE